MDRTGWILGLVVASLLAGCASQTIQSEELYQDEPNFRISEDIKIDDTAKNRQVLDVVARYREAMVQKDFGTLRNLVADSYYDNSGTTDTTEDDYGADRLPKIYEHIAQYGEDISYEMTIQDIRFDRGRAFVRYQYRFAYRSTVGKKPTWDAAEDVNELELIEQEGRWRIASGL